MANLKTVLERSAATFLKGGGAVSAPVKKALREHRARQYRTFWMMASLVGCGLVLCFLTLFEKGSQQSHIGAGLFGIGSGGGLEALRRVWRDCSETSLLIILVEDANEAQVATLVNKLIKKL